MSRENIKFELGGVYESVSRDPKLTSFYTVTYRTTRFVEGQDSLSGPSRKLVGTDTDGNEYFWNGSKLYLAKQGSVRKTKR